MYFEAYLLPHKKLQRRGIWRSDQFAQARRFASTTPRNGGW